MNLTNLLGARLGLEEISEDLSPDYNPADVSDTTMLEMEKAHESVVSTEAAMSMLSDTTDSLERIAAVLESITSPTLSVESAALINLAYENAMHPIVKYDSTQGGRYAGDSAGGNTTEKEKKSILEKIIAAWDAFVLLLSKIWDALSNFFQRLFSTAGMMRRKAEALLKTARTVKNNDKAPAFTMNVNELQIDGKVPSPDEVVTLTKSISKTYAGILTGNDSLMSGTFIKAYTKEIEKIAKPIPDDATFDTHGDKQADFFAMRDVINIRTMLATSVAKAAKAGDIGKVAPDTIGKQYAAGTTVRISNSTLFGDRVFVFISSPGDDIKQPTHADFNKWLKTLKFDLIHTGNANLDRSEINPLSVSMVADVLGEVINICQDIEIYKKQWFIAQETTKKLNNTFLKYMRENTKAFYLTDSERQKAEEMRNRRNAGDRPGTWETLSFLFRLDYLKAIISIVKATQGVVTAFSSFEGKVSKQAMRNSHGLIVYCQKSLNAHIGNPNDDFEAGPNATKNSKGYQEHERSTPGSKGFTNSRDDISDADLVV